MPKLTLNYEGETVVCDLSKVDRKTVYGYKETLTLDEEGHPCRWATLARDGMTLIPAGGKGAGYLSPEGRWRDKGALSPVDVEGNPLDEVPSTFKAPVTLAETASVDAFYEYNIRLVYALSGEGFPEALLRALSAGTIFTFPFSYRGGLLSDTAFLLQGVDSTCWLLVGKRNKVQYLDYQAVVLPPEDEEDDDLLSFEF